MLIFAKTGFEVEGVNHTLRVRGEEIGPKIRPLASEVIEKIRKKYRKTVRERDSQTRQMITTEFFDEEAILLELIDYVLEDFEGIGGEDWQPLPATPENKRRVMNLPPSGSEQSIAEFVFEQARELAAVKSEDLEEQIKNDSSGICVGFIPPFDKGQQ